MDPNEQEAAKTAEHFESIPWSSLASAPGRRGRRAVVIALMIVAGAVLGFLGGKIVRGATSSGVVVTLPPLAASDPVVIPPVEAAAAQVVIPTTGAPDEAPLPLPPQLYSEADLMAVLPEEEMRLAVMRAEWFVADMFTVDGQPAGIDDVTEALPDAIAAIPLPHRSSSGGISYVEWARAYRVVPLGPARYRVSVAFRTLAGPTGALTRNPVRAVTVDIEVGPDGATGVLDLPAPVPLPTTLALEGYVPPEAEAPPDVLAGALEVAAGTGNDPVVLSAGIDGDGWRIIVLVGDASGYRWPLVVRP